MKDKDPGLTVVTEKRDLIVDWQRPISQVRVRAASPRHIRYLTLRRRPHGPHVGRIWNARTVDYKTLKPYPGGLFCESVFGPVLKGVCACGRTRRSPSVTRVCVYCAGTTTEPTLGVLGQKPTPGHCPCGRTSTEVQPGEPIFCGYCGTEISLDPRARRYRLGYLPLAAPIAHPWYYRGQPPYLAHLLGFSRRKLEALLKCEGGLANQLALGLGFQRRTLHPSDFAPVDRLAPLSGGEERKGRRPRRRRIAKQPPRRTVKPLSLVGNIIFTFPWYCLYRDARWRPQGRTPTSTTGGRKKVRSGSTGRDREGLGLLTTYFLSEPKPQDQPLARYQNLPGVRETRPLSIHAPRTGGDLLLERLQSLDPVAWVAHGRAGLSYLDDEISHYETRILRKTEGVGYRRLLRQRGQLLRRLRILAELRVANVHPSWLRLQCLPVLPADLRPAIPRGEGLVRVSDVNKLYQRVISRNLLVAEIRRETTVQENSSYRGDLRYAQRLLQEGIDALIENGRGGAKPETDSRGRRLKSLSETLKGKRGRFRRNLLGKRVDYSGRSVIVSGPELSLHQCGLPRERAVILLQPFLLRHLRGRSRDGEIIQNRLRARKRLEQPSDAVWAEVARAANSLPVLLNRAPTLHRFGFQAFQPRIIRGRAILLHPLACSGFNADFDGDQRAVHVPLSSRARAEAWRLRTPGAHFFSPATGEPAFLPSQDRVLGCYYVTLNNQERWDRWAGLEPFFPNLKQVREEVELGNLHVHQPIWLQISGSAESDELEQFPDEVRIWNDGVGLNQYFHRRETTEPLVVPEVPILKTYLRTTVGRVRRSETVLRAVQTAQTVG
jgi:DNA-directed RNA polymerase beta' subunit